MKIFKKVNDKIYVDVAKLDVYIPERYTEFKFCTIEEYVTTFGILDLVVNDSELHGLLLPNFITLDSKEVTKETIDNKSYIKCGFKKNDVFMSNRTIIKNKFLVIRMFKEFIGFANLPRFINYENCHKLFSNVQQMADMNLNAGPEIMEMIFAYLYRSSNNLRIQARYINKNEPNEFIGLRNVSYGPDSTSAKIFGSYMADGINSSLVNPNEESKQLEDIMRL